MCENGKFSLSGSHIFSNTEVFFSQYCTVFEKCHVAQPYSIPMLIAFLLCYKYLVHHLRSVYVSCSVGDQLLTDINYRHIIFI